MRGRQVDGATTAPTELREAIGRSLALSTPGERPVALLVERSVPAADVAPVLRALVDLPTREIVVLLRSIRGVQLPEVPDPTAATARDIQVRAILASTHDRMARVHAMSALGPRLAVPAGTCPELDVALRSPASSLPDCRAAASDVAAVLRRCDLDDDATRRAATIVGLTWAPPETPPLATLRLSIGPGGRALAGPWEDLVHDLLSDERATVALP